MKALGLVVSDKKIFEKGNLKTYFLTSWPTYATNQNHLNNFGRGPPRDHSCEVWSKSNEWFQRRRYLCKKVYGRHRRTTHDGQRPVTIAHPEHKVLKWAKKTLLIKQQQSLLTGIAIKHMKCTCDLISVPQYLANISLLYEPNIIILPWLYEPNISYRGCMSQIYPTVVVWAKYIIP